MSSPDVDQILVVEERLRLAMLASDCNALDELISSDLIFTDHFGRVYGKQDDLGAHRSGSLKFELLQPAEIVVKVDLHIAVVSVRISAAGTYESMPFADDLRYTRVWRLSTRGAWQIVAGHSSRVQG